MSDRLRDLTDAPGDPGAAAPGRNDCGRTRRRPPEVPGAADLIAPDPLAMAGDVPGLAWNMAEIRDLVYELAGDDEGLRPLLSARMLHRPARRMDTEGEAATLTALALAVVEGA